MGHPTEPSLRGDSIFRALAASPDVDERRLAARHSPSPELLATLSDDDAWQVRVAVTRNPAADGALLASICSKRRTFAAATAAEHPNLPANVAETLAATGDPRAVEAVAANPHVTDTSTLRRLSTHHNPAVRRALAKRCTDSALLVNLSGDPVWSVRAAAATNPTTPHEQLNGLAADEDLAVRRSAAANPSTPRAALLALAGPLHELDADPAPPGRRQLVKTILTNPSCPPVILEHAGHSEQARMRAHAARHAATAPDSLRRLTHDTAPTVQVAVAENPSTPRHLLAAVSAGAAAPRRAAAARAETPTLTLVLLAGDADPSVRRCAAANPSLPAATAGRLAADPSHDVRAAVAAHHRLGPENLHALISDTSITVRIVAAANPLMPPAGLCAATVDAIEAVRSAAAANPATPQGLLDVLAGDEAPAVRCAVARRDPPAAGDPTPPLVL